MFVIPQNNWDFINDERMEELGRIYGKIDKFFPDEQNVLRFLNMDFLKIKYVIMGMEPYPSSFTRGGKTIPEATGRSFEVASLKDKQWSDKFKQSSLRNMIKAIYYNYTGEKISLDELRMKMSDGTFAIAPPGEWFDRMEDQGVLFLNATLTVEPYHADTHTKLWDKFMSDLIMHISRETDVKWMLWGGKAKERVLPLVNPDSCILSMHPRLDGFIEQNCFQYANDINWKGI